MRRTKNLFIGAVLSILIVFFLTGCDFAKSDEEIANEKIEELIGYMQNEDSTALKNVFAIKIISNIEDFDLNISELLAYFDEEYQSIKHSTIGTENDKNDGITKKWLTLSYDINTTSGIYRMAIKWYIKDTGEAGNVGIWSFYIINFDDDPNQQYSYGGDGLWSNGINIGKTYIEN